MSQSDTSLTSSLGCVRLVGRGTKIELPQQDSYSLGLSHQLSSDIPQPSIGPSDKPSIETPVYIEPTMASTIPVPWLYGEHVLAHSSGDSCSNLKTTECQLGGQLRDKAWSDVLLVKDRTHPYSGSPNDLEDNQWGLVPLSNTCQLSNQFNFANNGSVVIPSSSSEQGTPYEYDDVDSDDDAASALSTFSSLYSRSASNTSVTSASYSDVGSCHSEGSHSRKNSGHFITNFTSESPEDHSMCAVFDTPEMSVELEKNSRMSLYPLRIISENVDNSFVLDSYHGNDQVVCYPSFLWFIIPTD